MTARSGSDYKDGRRRLVLSRLPLWLGTGLPALALAFFNTAVAASEFDVPPAAALLAGIGQSAALVLLLIRPRAATVVQLLAVALFAVAIPPGSESTWPLTILGMIVLTAHIGLVAARAAPRTAQATWVASAALLALVVLLDPRGRPVADALPIMTAYLLLSALVLGVVSAVRRWQAIGRELAVARRDVEVEQGRRAVAEERTRIARELHDIVTHGMSVIHMQASSASYRIKNLDPEAKAEFGQIAAGARSTLREMRQLLAVLRDERAEAELAPMPGLGGLAELAESAGRAGVPVELRAAEAARAAVLPDGIALAAYRIAQESLSNVIRHAPGARTTISLDLDGSYLVLSVVNDAAAPPARPMKAPSPAGLGLAGMRERVRQAGGSLETGARD